MLKALMPVLLSGLLWTIAVPYFYGMTSRSVVHGWFEPVTNAALKVMAENLVEEEHEWNRRTAGTVAASLNSVTTFKILPHNNCFLQHFLEIPNPPPEPIL
jgi:hypothetical protein